MRKKLYIALFLSLFTYSKTAYAIFDIMALVQSALELKTEIENKIEEFQKMKNDMTKRLKQGFALGSSCFKNPMKCDVKSLEALGKDADTHVNRIKEFPVMPGASAMIDNDLSKIASEDLVNLVRNTYIYKSGQGKDLTRVRENRDNINAVVTDSAALLFAKGATTRHSIQEEDASIYQSEFNQDNIDEILSAQNKVGIMTASRLARILELRAFMVDAKATADLTQQTIDENDNGED